MQMNIHKKIENLESVKNGSTALMLNFHSLDNSETDELRPLLQILNLEADNEEFQLELKKISQDISRLLESEGFTAYILEGKALLENEKHATIISMSYSKT